MGLRDNLKINTLLINEQLIFSWRISNACVAVRQYKKGNRSLRCLHNNTTLRLNIVGKWIPEQLGIFAKNIGNFYY